MDDFFPFLKIFPVLLLALMSPGPTFVMVSNLALARGRNQGILCAAGIGTADLFYATLSLLGLGALMTELPILASVLKSLGGAYLAWIGYQIWKSTLAKPAAMAVRSDAPIDAPRQKSVYVLGILTNLTNPKVIIFYGSIFTAALAGNPSLVAKSLLPVLCAATAFLWYGFVAFILSQPRIRAHYEKLQTIIDRLAGTIMILFGAGLIVSSFDW